MTKEEIYDRCYELAKQFSDDPRICNAMAQGMTKVIETELYKPR